MQRSLQSFRFGKEGYKLKLCSGVYWNRGGREANQDSIALQQVLTNRGRLFMAVVCDGIGGLCEGENASGYISEKLIENFYRQLVPLAAGGKGQRALLRCLLRCFYEIRQEFMRYGAEREIELGSTVSLLLLWKRRYLLLHLGDSRIYRYAGKRRKLLTVDHSDGRNGLTKCLGSFSYQVPYIKSGIVWGNCGFLLCTDGFYRRQSEESMGLLEPSQTGGEEQIGRRLCEMAKLVGKRGEKDNMSAIYVKVCGGIKGGRGQIGKG